MYTMERLDQFLDFCRSVFLKEEFHVQFVISESPNYIYTSGKSVYYFVQYSLTSDLLLRILNIMVFMSDRQLLLIY